MALIFCSYYLYFFFSTADGRHIYGYTVFGSGVGLSRIGNWNGAARKKGRKGTTEFLAFRQETTKETTRRGRDGDHTTPFPWPCVPMSCPHFPHIHSLSQMGWANSAHWPMGGCHCRFGGTLTVIRAVVHRCFFLSPPSFLVGTSAVSPNSRHRLPVDHIARNCPPPHLLEKHLRFNFTAISAKIPFQNDIQFDQIQCRIPSSQCR